jgi:formylglycine-generating enzyme required for sulfatase activity
MKLVYIPPGEFMMGSPDSEKDRFSREGPQHRVRITKGFYMTVTEVTQAQWKAVMGNNPSNFKDDDLPVAQVSWDYAVEFCSRLSQKEGKGYRLPTEAEWEYACRAGTTTRFYFGDNDSMLSDYAWYYENTGTKTLPVGKKKPNSFGLYDMHGNVSEWCSDWYDEDYYSQSPVDDPKGPSTGQYRVIRGGSWNYLPRLSRSANRIGRLPDHSDYGFGFRVVVLDF